MQQDREKIQHTSTNDWTLDPLRVGQISWLLSHAPQRLKWMEFTITKHATPYYYLSLYDIEHWFLHPLTTSSPNYRTHLKSYPCIIATAATLLTDWSPRLHNSVVHTTPTLMTALRAHSYAKNLVRYMWQLRRKTHHTGTEDRTRDLLRVRQTS